MDVIKQKLLSEEALWSYIIIAITVALLIALNIFSNKYKTGRRIKGQRKTITTVCLDVMRVIIAVLGILFVLSVNGVNVTSLFAGLGIASAIVGLALQDLLKDLFMGYRIMSDAFYAIGDYVEFEGREGYISHFTLNTTEITDIADNSVFFVTNRNITKIRKLPNYFFYCVPISYDCDIEKAEGVLKTVCGEMKKVQTVIDCELLGADEFETSSISYKFKITCDLKFKHSLKRKMNSIFVSECKKNSLSIPYETIRIANK